VESHEPKGEEQRRDLEDVLGLVARQEDGRSLRRPQAAADGSYKSRPAHQGGAANFGVH
jgi:hypothetical protein